MQNHLTYAQSLSIISRHASVAELVDAVDSKSTVGNNVGVRFSPEAPIALALKSSDLGAFFVYSLGFIRLTESSKNKYPQRDPQFIFLFFDILTALKEAVAKN